MKTAVFAYSRRGVETGLRVGELLPEAPEYRTPEKYALPPYRPVAPTDYERLFREADALIFVSACGIAVRKIAPYIRSKTTDPAVICLDEGGNFVISLLSGHIGGANELAKRIAAGLGATPVVTTATDVRGRFSVDAWAAEKGYAISSMAGAKAVSAAILERDIPVSSEFPMPKKLPAGLYAGESGELGIYIGFQKREPFAETLQLIPKALHLGLGCRKGIQKEQVLRAIQSVMNRENLDIRGIADAGSITLKKDEEGLLEACRELEIPIRFYAPEVLNALPGTFTPSAFVASVTGVDNVCERAARMSGDYLIVKKSAEDGVTVALAASNWEVDFG